ncbi:MAG: VWA domain-containing protein [Pseudomonadota bacterium]|nr:VWA domain-containing protein [Pseudomonadota bacterium]
MSRRRRPVDIFNLSFLDVVSCGFGAIILLLVIVKISEPTTIEKLSVDLTGIVEKLEQELHEIRGQTTILNRDLDATQEQLSQQKEKLAKLIASEEQARGEFDKTRSERDTQRIVEGKLQSARQELSEEMRRLLGASYQRQKTDATIGGVPVDSEYIIFIIDTSGSMNRFAWPMVQKKIAEVLRIYPNVKGIQVMNDMGDYMFSQYRGRWIPDSPARRSSIIKRLSSWTPFSNSSPVEGIEAAIRRFYAGDKRISLYVFGDDFSHGSIQRVIDTVEQLNRADKSGRRRVRIHAVGFPVLFAYREAASNVTRFAALMRRLAETNNGTFVGLNTLQP